MFAADSAVVTACLSASDRLSNSVFCGGLDSAIHASAAAAISPISIAIGAERRTAGCAITDLIWRSGLANFSGKGGSAGAGLADAG